MLKLSPSGFNLLHRLTEPFGKMTCCTRLYFLAVLLLVMLSAQAVNASADSAPSRSGDYSKLIDWMAAGVHEDPLVALGEHEKAFSIEAHQSNLEFIQNRPDLIDTIKTKLDSAELSWELIDARQRLMAVPEKRVFYAALFETYCQDVIGYLEATTGLRSPYESITTLADDIVPELSTETGISVLLVHNLAEESIYTYTFQGPGEKSVAIKLNQTHFIGELGSYSSHLITHGDGSFEFVANHLTVWQNTADNPYSVLMVPAEETFHILLRHATEQAIKTDLEKSQKDQADPGDVVEEWVAVEEAIAGGLVNQLMPAFLEKHVAGFQTGWIEDDLVQKNQLNRYRYLRQGIQVVEKLGVNRALALYQLDPHKFRSLIRHDPDDHANTEIVKANNG